MKTRIKIFLSLICILTLTGCYSRDQADLKLQRACIAGVRALLPAGVTFGEFKSAGFEHSPIGPDFRHVTINAIQIDGWLEEEVAYECVFQETFGIFNMGYTASVHQVRIGNDFYGQAGSHITGTIDDFLKLTDAVREALYE
jgi:hypothetical protein